MTAQTHILPRKERMYAVVETTFDTVAEHAGANIVPMLGDASLVYDRGETELADKKDSVGVSSVIRDGRHTTTWSFPRSHLKTSDAAATQPQLNPFLRAWAGSRAAGNNTDAVQASPTPTATAFAVATIANFSVGSIIRMTSGVTSGEVAFVTGISGSTLTIAPALSGAPSSTDTLAIGESYPLTQDNTVSLSIAHEMAHTLKVASGCQCNSIGIGVGNSGTLQLEASGDGSGRISVAGTTLVAGGGINNSVTSITVTTSDGPKFLIDTALPMYATIEAEGANTAETVKITAVSGDVLTVVRAQKSTSASAHAAGAVIVPWSPSLTKVGTPRSGLVGMFKLGGSAFTMHTFDFKGDNGHAMHENNLGSVYSPGFDRDGVNPRKTSCSVTGKFSKDYLLKFGAAVVGSSTPLWLQIGTTANSIFALYAPAWRPKIPPLAAGGSPVATLALDGACLETSGNDEVYLGFV